MFASDTQRHIDFQVHKRSKLIVYASIANTKAGTFHFFFSWSSPSTSLCCLKKKKLFSILCQKRIENGNKNEIIKKKHKSVRCASFWLFFFFNISFRRTHLSMAIFKWFQWFFLISSANLLFFSHSLCCCYYYGLHIWQKKK